MRRLCSGLLLALVAGLSPGIATRRAAGDATPSYTVAFAHFGPRNSDLFIADADGKNAKPLVPHAENDCNASFSPDGQWVVFTSYRNGSADLYQVHPDGSGLERLTDDPAYDDQAAVSPNGKQIVFVSNRGGFANLWLLDRATKRVRRLTKHDSGDFRPSWSPDSQWIAFSSDRDSTKPVSRSGFGTLHVTEIYLVRPDGTGLRRMTKAQAVAGSPTWSPDGKKLVIYEVDLDEYQKIVAPKRLRGTSQIATIDVATGERNVITSGNGEKWSPRWVTGDRIAYVSGGPGGGIEFTTGPVGARGAFCSPNWSNDGRHMVFHREVGPDEYPPPPREWYSLDREFRLIRTGVFPSFSPEGSRLVCNSQPAAIIHNALVIMNTDGTKRSTLFEDPQASAVAPVWSPKGDKIAFGCGRYFQILQGPAIADIAVIGTDGKGFRRLTNGKGNSGFPSWAPDGRRLVYRTTSSDGKSSWLVIHGTETGEVKELRTTSTRNNFPAWSPTGDRIAFTAYVDGDYEICTIKPDGSEFKRLTDSPGNDSHCAWSPDGKWIAFTSARRWFNDETALHPYNGQSYGKIYVMRADGSDVRQLTEDQFEHGTPSFGPVPNGK
jgi:Tol biopolymer transport system component